MIFLRLDLEFWYCARMIFHSGIHTVIKRKCAVPHDDLGSYAIKVNTARKRKALLSFRLTYSEEISAFCCDSLHQS